MDLSATIHLLGDLLGQVISETESPEAFELEEYIRLNSKARRAGDQAAGSRLADAIAILSNDQARIIATAFSLYFDLVNLAEENHRVNVLRRQEQELHPAPLPDSIGEAVAALKAQGVSHDSMARLLEKLSIELVLTAHPTEAKRRTNLSKMQRITAILHSLSQWTLLPRELLSYRQALHVEITAFWLTERARTDRPTVTDEARTGLYFIEQVFWRILPEIYDDLDRALKENYPGLRLRRPWLRLASWIGGDRDGNPNVTTEITAETLRLHRGLAVQRHREMLQDLARRLSLSARYTPPPQALKIWFDSRRPLPDHIAYLEKRYAREPYRLALSLLADDLAEASQEDMPARLLTGLPNTTRTRLDNFLRPLEIIQAAIPRPIAEDQLNLVLRQFQIFGFHAARLDLREDSRRLRSSLGEILRSLDIEYCDFNLADSRTRLDILTQLFESSPPTLAAHPGVTPETAETWALFQLVARSRQVYGVDLFGPLIISMTHDAADVLTVLLIARWSGCADYLEIVPLFETIEDLKAASQIMADLFTNPVYRDHLRGLHNRQTVMIGYSDSNKDGGYLAANWALYQAQDDIARVCREYQIELTLFHGRGGTVARGGGPANRAIRAQPPGTVNGRFRLTEQGEIIAARYANPLIAHRHLEQIVSAVLLASSPLESPTMVVHPEWRSTLEAMAAESMRSYRYLVYETPGFLDYWRSVTPIEEIKRLQIGSRPSVRQDGMGDVRQIRAIPWVFSWMQSRFNIPGWFGLGSGLQVFQHQLDLLKEMYAEWSFFHALLDNAEMSLLKADMDIAHLYSDLMPDHDLAEKFFEQISEEYERTCRLIMSVTDHVELMENESVVKGSVHLRNPYIDPLNYVQVEMLRRLRSMPGSHGAKAEPLHEVMVLTINGIAAGLRNTG